LERFREKEIIFSAEMEQSEWTTGDVKNAFSTHNWRYQTSLMIYYSDRYDILFQVVIWLFVKHFTGPGQT